MGIPGECAATARRHAPMPAGAAASTLHAPHCTHGFCLFPAGTAEWFAALEEDMDEALAFERRWQRFDGERLHPLRDRHGASRAALDKALAVAGGAWPGTTRMRWPGEAVPPERARELRDHADRASVLWS